MERAMLACRRTVGRVSVEPCICSVGTECHLFLAGNRAALLNN